MKFYKILIVDDIDALNHIISCFDNINGEYLFYKATNVRDALQIYAEYAIDLIITEWEMPGVNGLELIKNIKNEIRLHNTPVIMIAGKMTCPEHLDIAFTAGATDFIRKPIEKIELIARVRSILLLADNHRETVELKNRDLVNAALHIVQNNEFNVKLRQRVIDLEKSFGNLDTNLTLMLKELNESLSEKIKAEAWDKFDAHFKQVHPGFFNRLITICPNISPAELRLAAFLKLSFGTKEIATILFLTVDSVRTARTRLRKKLKIKRDDNLMTFLLSI